MIKRIFITLLSLALFCGFVGSMSSCQSSEERLAQAEKAYSNRVSGITFSAYDSYKTPLHGTAEYYYTITFNRDGTCKLEFKYEKDDDNSIHSSNKVDSFTIEGLTWKIREYDTKDYRLYVMGSAWDDWNDYSAAKLSRWFELAELTATFQLKATRSDYYTVYFSEVE